jgi:predicted unusual protein kinase regulating ubiquinone biosynthesis (AarF/ABC1/UbiB family)
MAVLAAAAGAAGYGGQLAYTAWRRRNASSRSGLPSGRIQRTARLATASARTATDLAMTRARQAGKTEAERAEIEEAFHLRTAEQVLDVMGEMKGALMKIGQLMSFIDTGLPEPFRQALAGLQADAPPMAYELVEQVVAAELGAGPQEVFADFAREPMAAASIGQVHAARLHDGLDVVVKVQYPGVDDAIRADLDNADLLYTLMRAVYPNLDPKPVVAELRERIGEELDYTVEAKHQQAFLDIYSGHPFIHVPEVFPALSSRRVLTMERSSGLRWREALDAPQDLKDRWGEVVYRYVFGTINRFHMFNGDPHPGNYLFHDDGTVTFLDYGCVKHFSPEHIAEQQAMMRAQIDDDAEAMRGHLVAFGFIRPDDDLDPRRHLDWWHQWDDHLLAEQPFTYTPEFAEAAVKANYDPTGEWAEVSRRMNLPKDFVFLTRINLGVNSVLAGLRATGRWRGIADEWWAGAPAATDLGRLDADFFAAPH